MIDTVVAVAGTGTDVGKTWVTAHLCSLLRGQGLSVAARKPAQSYAHDTPITERDASILAAATGEHVDDVCPPGHSYEVAMAPPMAADALGRPTIHLRDLLAALRWPAEAKIGFVETAGGVRSPIAHDADNVDFIDGLGPDLVLLVADAGLGTISVVRLCVDALRDHDVLVLFNRFDPESELHVRNAAWLAAHHGLTVVTSVESVAARLAIGRTTQA